MPVPTTWHDVEVNWSTIRFPALHDADYKEQIVSWLAQAESQDSKLALIAGAVLVGTIGCTGIPDTADIQDMISRFEKLRDITPLDEIRFNCQLSMQFLTNYADARRMQVKNVEQVD